MCPRCISPAEKRRLSANFSWATSLISSAQIDRYTFKRATACIKSQLSTNTPIISRCLWYKPSDLQLPVKYPCKKVQLFLCHGGVIPRRQVLVMGTIVTRGMGGGEKRSTEKAVTPKPQMPAVGESCVYTRLPSLAADCVEAECYTC